MKHSRKKGLWVCATARHGPGGTCVLRIAYSIRMLGNAYGASANVRTAILINTISDCGRTHGAENRVIGLTHVPRGGFTRRIQRGFHAHQGHRSVATMLDILFSGPDEFDRRTRQRLGNSDGLPDKLNRQATPSKPAANMDFMDLDVTERDLRSCRRYCRRGLTVLRRRPYIDPFVCIQHRAVLRLHGRVFEIGRVVFRLDGLRRRCERVLHISFANAISAPVRA